MKLNIAKRMFCPKCSERLKTYPEGHKLEDKIFICYHCDSVFERQNDDTVKESETLTVI